MPLPSWKKVLVVDLGFLGDTVHSIPALRALAQSGAKVDVLTTTVGHELLQLVPEIHRTWVIPLRKPSPPPWQHLHTLRLLRAQKYDAALSFVGSDRNLFCTGWSGARDRIAHLTGPSSWLARQRLTRQIPARDRAQPVFEQRLALLRELGWEGSPPGWAWRFSAASEGWAQAQLGQPALHLSLSAASSPLNEWPLPSWAETLHCVWAQAPQLQVYLTGSGSDREKARQVAMIALVQDKRLHNFSDRLSLDRLAALLQASTLHLGLDSGVLHLAMALGRPTVSLFRDSIGFSGWAPRGEKHLTLVQKCSCHQTGQNTCPAGQPLCLSQIKPSEVTVAVLSLLAKSEKI